jgi:uncharacterized Zn finger protein
MTGNAFGKKKYFQIFEERIKKENLKDYFIRKDNMKEVFEDESYIELTKKDNNIVISLATTDSENENVVTMISVEIDKNKLLEMIKSL